MKSVVSAEVVLSMFNRASKKQHVTSKEDAAYLDSLIAADASTRVSRRWSPWIFRDEQWGEAEMQGPAARKPRRTFHQSTRTSSQRSADARSNPLLKSPHCDQNFRL